MTALVPLIVPALLEMAHDPEFSGPPMRVYVVLMQDLDPEEFRPVKAWALTLPLRMKAHTVGAALRKLRDAGFIEEGERTKYGVRTFRIRYVRSRAAAGGGLSPERQHSPAS